LRRWRLARHSRPGSRRPWPATPTCRRWPRDHTLWSRITASLKLGSSLAGPIPVGSAGLSRLPTIRPSRLLWRSCGRSASRSSIREVLLATRQFGRLLYDADLTGREVSPTSQTYPDAAFGWMSDHVGLGYQAAVVSMTSPTYGRILLESHRHPGDTVSVECLQELVLAAEAATGVRPRRRPELVAQRLASLADALEQHREQVRLAEERLEKIAGTLEGAKAPRSGGRSSHAPDGSSPTSSETTSRGCSRRGSAGQAASEPGETGEAPGRVERPPRAAGG